MNTTRRISSIGAIALASIAAAAVAVVWMSRPAEAATTVDLAPLVDSWPNDFTVTGTKAEPLYTENIEITRDGSDFAVTIDVVGQGDAAFGTQNSAVTVENGTVRWTDGCIKTAAECDADASLRGFLETAQLVALAENDALPTTGTLRTLHGREVVCVDDAAVHPDAPTAVVTLDPCFDVTTGATLGHWSPDSDAFVAATLAAGFRIDGGSTPE